MKSLIADTNLGTLQAPSELYGAGDAVADGNVVLTSFETLLSTIVTSLTVFAGIFFVIYFFLAGLKWLTAGGDGGKVQKARDEMVQGVMGLIVVVAAYGIIGLIGAILGIDLLNPSTIIRNTVESIR